MCTLTSAKNKPKVQLVYSSSASHHRDSTCRSTLHTSVQTEYAIALSNMLTEINAPTEVIKAANEKLRSGIDAKLVYDMVEKIIKRYRGEIYRTHEPVYDFSGILQEIMQIGQEIKRQPLICYGNIEDIHLSGKYISDILKDETENILQPYSINIIDAPTGMGKTTFVCDHILKTIRDSGKTAILLSNRVCLGKASKRDICRSLGVEYQMDIFSEDGINDAFRVIGSSIYAISYQQAAAMFYKGLVENSREKTNNHIKRYGFLEKLPFHPDLLLLDECQWFWSDANFSAINWFLWSKLMKQYPAAAKCFISATVTDDLLTEIDNYLYTADMPAIQKIQRHNFLNTYGVDMPFVRNKAVHYKISRDEKPATHNLQEFDSFADLLPEITRTAGEKCKWLIFTDSKEEARKLRDSINEELGNIDDTPSAVFVSAESKTSEDIDGQILQELVEKQDFSCSVLIASSVIDSGLSIKSKNLKYIVLPPYAPDTFIQAYGRDRLRNEKKTIYVKKITPKDIAKHINRAKRILALNEAFEDKDYWTINTQFADELYKSFLILPDGKLEINKFAVLYSKRMLELFTEVKEKLEQDRYYYLRLQAQWLNLPESSVHSIIDKNEELFISFMEEYRNNYPDGMSKAIFAEFREKFKENCLKWLMPIADARADRTWGLDIIERTLEFNGFNQYSIDEKRKGAGGKDGMFYYINKAESIST